MYIHLKNIIKRLLHVFPFIFIAAEINLFWIFGYSPTLKDLKEPPISIASEIYTADSVLIGKFYRENRVPVAFEQIPQNAIDALIATEDIRFYKHNGIDFYSLVGSLFSTISGEKRGGSTITQQLAKNLYETRRNSSKGLLQTIPFVKTVIFKSKEWISAIKLESMYSKEEILTLYFNTVSFGNNSYGIKVATNTYFSKDVKDLSNEEAALLVGLLKATSTYNPLKNPENAIGRRNVVLGQMIKYNLIDTAAYEKAIKTKLKLKPDTVLDKEEKDSYIRMAVRNSIKKWADDNYIDIYSDGLKIYTTIDSRLQKHAENAVESHMSVLQNRFYNHWGNKNPWTYESGEEIPNFIWNQAKKLPVFKYLSTVYDGNEDSIYTVLSIPKKMTVFSWNGDREVNLSTLDSLSYYAKLLHTGFISIKPTTGEIKAWVGGINAKYFKFDQVIQSKRQAGSTFKPFVYAAAINSGWSPCDKLVDKPITIRYSENGEEKTWSPKNSDWIFTGYDMSLRWAMGKSCNSVTAQLTEKIGWDKVAEFAKLVGIESKLEAVPSIGLGSNDVSLYEMVAAYGVFLNEGIKTTPILIQKIADNQGKLLIEYEPKSEKVLDYETSWLMLHMFKGGIQEPGGTSQALWGYDLWRKGNEIGGKTGTTTNCSDGWYIGITKDLVSGVWVGAQDPSVHFRTNDLGEGSKTALPIFGKFMESVYRDVNSGVTLGKFPEPKTPITKKYNCTTPRPRIDTLVLDSIENSIAL